MTSPYYKNATGTVENAQNADTVGADPRFTDLRASIADSAGMGHYAAQATEPQSVAAGHGIEIGRFRLKPGVSEAEMHRAYAAMVERHLCTQPGWRRQHLVKLDDGVFVDLAFAEERAHAEAICASWQGQADCDAFLALIEPLSMEFGTLL